MSFDPVSVENAIRECANRIAKGVTICGNQYAAFLPLTGHTTRRSRSLHRCGWRGARAKYIAELATVEEREARMLLMRRTGTATVRRRRWRRSCGDAVGGCLDPLDVWRRGKG
ncbi:hypothetical protein GS931_21600 [Rhodococcus hoagii]|nr:hypothetical protein [Prescottella equi]